MKKIYHYYSTVVYKLGTADYPEGNKVTKEEAIQDGIQWHSAVIKEFEDKIKNLQNLIKSHKNHIKNLETKL